MTTDGEFYTEGIYKCRCGSTDFKVEIVDTLFVSKSAATGAILKEFYENDSSFKVFCQHCKKQQEA